MRKCILTILLHIGACAMAQPVILIDSNLQSINISKQGYVRTGNDFLPFDKFKESWLPLASDKLYWLPNNTQWFYCKLKNNAGKSRVFKLWLNNVQAGVTQMYLVRNGVIDSSQKTGSLLGPKQRSTGDRLLSMQVVLNAGEETGLYLKSFRRQIGITVSPMLYNVMNDNINERLDNWMIFGLSFMLIISITALSIYFSFPSKELFWFAAYSFAVLFYSIAVSGFGSLYIWGSFPLFEENAAVFLGSLASVCLFQLSRLLFNTAQAHKKTDRFLGLFNVANIVVAALGFNMLINYFSIHTFTILLLLLYLLQIVGYVVIFILALAAVFVQKKKEFILIALLFGIILIAVNILILQETGAIPFNYRFHSYIIAFSLFPQTLIPLLFFVKRIEKQLQQKGEQIMQERLMAESNILNERIRLGRELHDDIGGTMSGIKLYSHLAGSQLDAGNSKALSQSLQTIQQSAEEMILRINDQVWLMQSNSNTLEQVLQHLVEYAGKMAFSKNMDIKISVGQNITSEDDSKTHKNLYLLCKEAINNAVKYSEGSMLIFEAWQQEEVLQIIIADNGKGFDTGKEYPGNGLKNMKQRAQEIEAKLTFESSPMTGTKLVILK